MSNYLFFISTAYKIEIHSFVLMNNHFHLIARFPENNMSEAMNYFMRETSRVISRSSMRINQTYGGRYFRSAITKPHYLEHVYKYVYRNPIEAGLASNAEEYPYSTLSILLGKKNGIIPLIRDPRLEPKLLESTLRWLNKKPVSEDKEEVRKALRKPQFTLTTKAKNMFVHHLEVDRL
ncbi:transposase [Bdellovibrio svalbardensis]